MGGELIARGIVEADPTWRLFAPYELVWAGGVLGRVLAQGIYWGTRPIERIEQGLARYRERARTRRRGRLAARNGHDRPSAPEAPPAARAPPPHEPPAAPPA
jgi:2Fe-2S ferredoxin